ncbi:Formamidopyrimidine-DNA glycosylase [hydrothermal vent metagenome]|uniref:Formamidopyrimidine-DNA glycosylase n=1 Tax=hydrothermal vent metagenome TaxID=652676 RepID=A0A3B1ANS7_9ZZZZ
MPELPEVETTVNGITPLILQQKVTNIIIREHQLRWPIPNELAKILKGKTVISVARRAKYILIQFKHGTLILHLGMSGNLRFTDKKTQVAKHDHVDIIFNNTHCLRYHDPRRFGAILWTNENIEQHKLISHLGPEPLHAQFDVDYLYKRSRKRTISVKQFIMDSKVVVGVGNIYASESLYLAGIKPTRTAGGISKARYLRLCNAIKTVLNNAIAQGGTTLRDFRNSDGKPGYFKQKLNVYDREGLSCKNCTRPIKLITQNNRSSYYCNFCQC